MRSRFLAFALIAGLLAACTSSKPGPTPTPTPTDTPTTSVPSSTPSAPRTGPLTTGPNVRPGDAPPELGSVGKRHTPVGGTVAGAYYFKALDWTIATNDDWLIWQIGLKSCHACQRVHDGLIALRSKHETERGGRIHIRSAVVDGERYQRKYDLAVRVTYNEEPVRLVSADGTSRVTQPGANGIVDIVFLVWRHGWHVLDVAQA